MRSRGLVTTVAGWVDQWATASQHEARRNAMVAATACAQRRAERQDVAEFLAARQPRVDVAPAPSPEVRTRG